MAKKKKGPRQTVGLVCSVCKNFNYVTQYNKNNEILKNQKDESKTFPLNKYCKKCRKATSHKLKKKLK
ncbi:MAG: 50S ribosomal protein L33 [Patescibacteria group bacterium]